MALIEACKMGKGKRINIYTDSAYAFSTVHVFAAQWGNRGMVTSTGKPILHKDLILHLLDAVLLPKAIAICKCAAHTKGKDPISSGNRRADTKEAAQGGVREEEVMGLEIQEVDHEVLSNMQNAAPPTETHKWNTEGG